MKMNVFDPRDFEPHGACHVASAIIGTVGAVGGGLISASASKSAANKQAQAAQAGIDAQREMFGMAREELLPYIEYGKSFMPAVRGWIDPSQATSPLASLLKLTTPGADMSATLAQTPGYQFTETMGNKAVRNALAARGLGGPGGALARGAADYTTGLAQNTWQSVVNSLINTFTAGANPLLSAVNTGSGAAQSLAGNAVQTGGQLGQSYGNLGNAQAAGIMGPANAITGMLNNAGSTALNYSLLSKLGGGGGGGGLYPSPAPWQPSTAWYNN